MLGDISVLPVDILTIMSALVACIVFFIAHIIMFQAFQTQAVMRVLSLSLVLSAAFHLAFYGWLYASGLYAVWMLMESYVLSVLVFVGGVFLYIAGIFGISVTSIRVQLLRKIDQSGSSGIARDELVREYDIGKIVETRLSRLDSSGEIINTNGHYLHRPHVSPFSIHGFIVKWFYFIYSPLKKS